MTSKLLRVIGVLAIVALIGGSFAALAVVQSRVHVTIADEEALARRGPDPVALVAADVAAVRDEVRALGEGVGTQMQTLHDALETSAEERGAASATEVAALRRELAAIRTLVDREANDAAGARAQTARALDALTRRVDEIASSATGSALPGTAIAAADGASVEAPAITVPVVEAVASEAPTAEPAAVPTDAPAPEKDEAPKKKFLSFTLPSQGFVFDRRQRFAIVASLSRVGFDAKSTLHDFSGVTSAVEGEIVANLAHPAEGCGGAVVVKSSTIDTGVEGRDESVREILEPAKFPELRFDWTAFEPTSVDETAQKVAGTARGKLSIHGVARDVSMPVTVAVDASRRLAIDGQTKIKMSDFGLSPPSKLGVIKVEDEAVLWIALRARTLGPAAEAKR